MWTPISEFNKKKGTIADIWVKWTSPDNPAHTTEERHVDCLYTKGEWYVGDYEAWEGDLKIDNVYYRKFNSNYKVTHFMIIEPPQDI